MDLTKVQVQRHHLFCSRKTVAREIVEVVVTKVQELGGGGIATGNFGKAPPLTGGMLCLNLSRGWRERRCIQ